MSDWEKYGLFNLSRPNASFPGDCNFYHFLKSLSNDPFLSPDLS